MGFVKFTQIKAAIAFGESFPEASETVNIAKAKWSSFQPTVTIAGQVVAKLNVDVRNEVDGILTSVDVASAGRVSKGDMLAQLNIDTEKAQLDAVQAEIDLAKLDVGRFSNLVDVRASSKEQLDRAKALLAVNQARARALQATIDKKTLKAPFSGVTSIHDWQVGAYLPANSIFINIVGDNDAVWLDFKLPQIYANVKLGTPVKVSGKALANGQGESVAGDISAKVVAINQQLDPNSRTVQAIGKKTLVQH